MFSSALFRKIFFPVLLLWVVCLIALYYLFTPRPQQLAGLIQTAGIPELTQTIQGAALELDKYVRATKAAGIPLSPAEHQALRQIQRERMAAMGLSRIQKPLMDHVQGRKGRVLALCLLLLLASVGAMVFILQSALTPVRHLRHLSEKLIKGELAACNYITGPAEIGTIGAALYHLAWGGETLAEYLDGQNKRLADQMRTNEHLRNRTYILARVNRQVRQRLEEREKEIQELKKSEDRYKMMLNNIEEGYYEVDLLGNLVFFNASAHHILGYSGAELWGMNFREFMDKENAKKAARVFNQVFETGQPAKSFDWELIRKDRSKAYVAVSASPMKDAKNKTIGFRGIVKDMSEIRYLLDHDPLTELYNRTAYFDRLEEALVLSRRYNREKAIFYMDLDNFKRVNDTYRHKTGDKVLEEVSRRLQETLRESDHICRLGGDEFTVILNNPDGTQAEQVADRIIESLSGPYHVDDHVIDYISPSIGIGIFPRDGLDAEALTSSADTAMYAAKKRGGGQYVFFADLKPEEQQALKRSHPRNFEATDKATPPV